MGGCYRRVAPAWLGAQRGLGGGRLKPAAKALVDLGVIQQREMVGRADVMSVLGLEGDPASTALSRGARHEHEDVAKQATHRMARTAGDGRRNEAVGRSLQERHLLACRRP